TTGGMDLRAGTINANVANSGAITIVAANQHVTLSSGRTLTNSGTITISSQISLGETFSYLTLNGTLTNTGTVTLTSTGGGYDSGILGGGTINNNAGGTFTVAVGASGPRSVVATLNNAG